MAYYTDEKVYPSEFMLMVINGIKDKKQNFDVDGFVMGFEEAKEDRLVDSEKEQMAAIFRRGSQDVLDSINSLDGCGYIDRHMDDHGTLFFTINEESFENGQEKINELKQTIDENVVSYASRIAETLGYIDGIIYTPVQG